MKILLRGKRGEDEDAENFVEKHSSTKHFVHL